MLNIETDDLGVSYEDCGAWRSYSAHTQGETVTELLENCMIVEIDQDGGDIAGYPLCDATGEVAKAAERWIDVLWRARDCAECGKTGLQWTQHESYKEGRLCRCQRLF